MKKVFSIAIILLLLISCKKDKVEIAQSVPKDNKTTPNFIVFKLSENYFESAYEYECDLSHVINDSIPFTFSKYFQGTFEVNRCSVSDTDIIYERKNSKYYFVSSEKSEGLYQKENTALTLTNESFQLYDSISNIEIENCWNKLASRTIFKEFRTSYPNSKIAIIKITEKEFDALTQMEIPVSKYLVCLMK